MSAPAMRVYGDHDQRATRCVCCDTDKGLRPTVVYTHGLPGPHGVECALACPSCRPMHERALIMTFHIRDPEDGEGG